MGTLTKRLGQLAARSLESESSNILKTARANKVPGSLALALDQTLRKGHDMRTFGLGTAASIASRARYSRFTTSMHAIYTAMEEEFDSASPEASPVVHALWQRHGDTLRRSSALRQDLEDVLEEPGETDMWGVALDISPATRRYVTGIQEAGADDRERGGARMLGHLYCRYFADLFGGSVLAAPTRAALTLPADTPRHYSFALPPDGRRAFIESVYSSLNVRVALDASMNRSDRVQDDLAAACLAAQDAGNALPAAQVDEVVQEALHAFAHNIAVYGEEPMAFDAVRGVAKTVIGFAKQPREALALIGR